jgi:hypothetical protein
VPPGRSRPAEQPTEVFKPRQREALTEKLRPVREEAPPAAAAPTEAFRKRTGPASPSGPGGPGPDGTGPQPSLPPAGGRFHRLRTGLVIGLVALFVLLAVGDRIAARVAASQISRQIQTSQKLPTKPKATVGGVPFLTQVLLGKYDDLGITINRISTPGPCVDQVNAHLKGVHVPLSKGISGKIGKVPIDHITGTARITYTDLNAYLATALASQNLSLTFAPGSKGSAKVTASIPTQIGLQSGGASVKLGISDHELTITVVAITAFGISLQLPQGFSVPIPVPVSGLPFNLRLTKASAEATGLELGVAADHLTVNAPNGSSNGKPIKAC